MLGGQQATSNHGTAAVSPGRLERILVEEEHAVERDARDEPVVHDPLQDVDILRVAVKKEEPLVPEGVADGRARLGVGRVGKFIVLAETLVEPRATRRLRSGTSSFRQRSPTAGRWPGRIRDSRRARPRRPCPRTCTSPGRRGRRPRPARGRACGSAGIRPSCRRRTGSSGRCFAPPK